MTGSSGAVFVLPGTTAGQRGPVASWVSTAGWADAARRVLGQAWIATQTGVVEPDEARTIGSNPALSTANAPTWQRHIPLPVKTAIKDVRQWQRARSFSVTSAGPWDGTDLAFVWQRHELFHHAGLDLAQALGVPSVLFAPATIVWEAQTWGVRRRGWSGPLERSGEAKALNRADLVACGSELVKEQVLRLGVAEERTLITPTGVDLTSFAKGHGSAARRRADLGLADRFVVGWVGSFRSFHAVEQLVDAVAGISDATLLLVGDGPERAAVEARARAAGVATVSTGTVAHSALPELLAAMDVAVVLAPQGRPFHYSPLKLAEYLAAGLPVVAPDLPQLADRLTPGEDCLLVPPGHPEALASAIQRLRHDPELRRRLGTAAQATASAAWSWDRQIERVVAHLQAVPGQPAGGRP